MAKKAKDKQVTHIEKEILKARLRRSINEAIKVIEKEYGKGAIMDISSENPIKVEAVFFWFSSYRLSTGNRWISKRKNSGSLWTRIFWENNYSSTRYCRSSKKLEELQHLSMQRMHLILNMLKL